MKNVHVVLFKWRLGFSAEHRKIQVTVAGHSTFDNQIRYFKYSFMST